MYDEKSARKEYKTDIGVWFFPDHYTTEWYAPEYFSDFLISANQFTIKCNIFAESGAETCKLLAQYDIYMVRFDVRQQGLEYRNFASSVKNIDEKMVGCLSNGEMK